MRDIWLRIEDWLECHAPEVLARLAPPASQQQMQLAEEELGFELPAELRSCSSIHDGSSGIPLLAAGPLFSIERILDEWSDWQAMYGHLDEYGQAPKVSHLVPDAIKPVAWNEHWLPFTGMFGSCHCIDLDPADSGTRGQIITYSQNVGPCAVVSENLTQYMSQFVDNLDHGHYFVSDGAITYAPRSVRRKLRTNKAMDDDYLSASISSGGDPLDELLDQLQPGLGHSSTTKCSSCGALVRLSARACPKCAAPMRNRT